MRTLFFSILAVSALFYTGCFKRVSLTEAELYQCSNADVVGLAPLEVAFDAQAVGGDGKKPKEVEWTFGDGGSSDEIAPLHLYKRPGHYTVTCKVEDDAGLEAVRQLRVCVAETGVGEPQLIATARKVEPVLVVEMEENGEQEEVDVLAAETPEGRTLEVTERERTVKKAPLVLAKEALYHERGKTLRYDGRISMERTPALLYMAGAANEPRPVLRLNLAKERIAPLPEVEKILLSSSSGTLALEPGRLKSRYVQEGTVGLESFDFFLGGNSLTALEKVAEEGNISVMFHREYKVVDSRALTKEETAALRETLARYRAYTEE